MHGLQDTAGQLQETVKDQASAIADQASALAEQTKESWERGQKAVSDWEEQLEDSIRDHPMLYLGGALAIIGLLIAKMMFDRSHR